MTFDKRDYLYDDEVFLEEAQNDIHEGKVEHRQIDRFPMEWVQSLMFQLQEMSKAKGVELLDQCTSVNLASFAGRYNTSAWRY
jgi:hypothetical protein